MEEPSKKLYGLNPPFRGPVRRKLFSVVSGAVEKMLAIDKVNQIYYEAATSQDPSDTHFTGKILNSMHVQYDVRDQDLARIPAQGPVVVVANHPFGGLEGIILGSLLKSVRPDVKLMANFLLERIPDLRDFFIFVDPFGGPDSAKTNMKPLKDTMSWLKDGGMLGVFPAGEVSSLDVRKGGVVDPVWSTTIAKIVKKTEVSVLPVYFSGSNSIIFQLLGMVHPRLRTAMLPHELVNKINKTIHVAVGNVIPYKNLKDLDDAALMEYIRMRTYNLGNRKKSSRKKRIVTIPIRIRKPVEEQPVIDPVPQELQVKEIEAFMPDQLLVEGGELVAYGATSRQIPHILREIGRLREITFRDVNEGTGQPIDLDRFDDYYYHIFIWNKVKNELVGAYRLGKTDEIMAQFGKRGLYTSTLFKYRKKLLKSIGPAIEMGRSFIRKEYQKNYSSLLVLWRGLAHYIAKNPDYKIVFGPVSINSEYQSTSRQMLVNFLKMNESLPELAKLVKARKPLRTNPIKRWKNRKVKTVVRTLDEVESLIADIEHDLTGVPILLRQYLKLGGKLLAFNIDPDFSYVLDGLILVDLSKSDPKVMGRYMGKDNFDRFRVYHGLPVSETAQPASAGAGGVSS